MSINSKWIQQLPVKDIQKVTPVSGGYMNAAYCIQTRSAKYFMKVQPKKGKRFFKYEVDGLNLITKVAPTPKVITCGQVGDDGYLILDWQPFINFKDGDQYKLGEAVARIHQIHNDKFGFNCSFRLGPIFKNNTWQTNWITFYVKQRLDPEVQMLKHMDLWNSYRDKHYQNLRTEFIDYYSDPRHKVVPSLLHGDLWAGNCGFTSKEQPVIIDPNVIYGDRELDLGIASWVASGDNFNQDFYRGYNHVYPVKKAGLHKRLLWYRINYVFNNVIIFNHTNDKVYLDKLLRNF